MPKKEREETQEEQSERFKKAVQDMIDAGELNPTEADEAFEKLTSKDHLLQARETKPDDS